MYSCCDAILLKSVSTAWLPHCLCGDRIELVWSELAALDGAGCAACVEEVRGDVRTSGNGCEHGWGWALGRVGGHTCCWPRPIDSCNATHKQNWNLCSMLSGCDHRLAFCTVKWAMVSKWNNEQLSMQINPLCIHFVLVLQRHATTGSDSAPQLPGFECYSRKGSERHITISTGDKTFASKLPSWVKHHWWSARAWNNCLIFASFHLSRSWIMYGRNSDNLQIIICAMGITFSQHIDYFAQKAIVHVPRQ